jgi:Spy/CpxP family protein refolding chaperone
MKKSLMLAIVMMTSTIIFAQHAKSSHKGHTDRFEKMKTDLALTDAQYASIKSIDTKYNNKRDALKNDTAQTREAKGAAFKTMRTDEENEIAALLTADQKTKWDKLKAEHGEKRKEHFQKISEQREAKLKTTLGLSDDQSQKMKAVNQQFMEKFGALRKSDTKDKAAFEKLKTDHEAAIKGILTPEQFQKWNTMRADMRKKHGHEHGHMQKG